MKFRYFYELAANVIEYEKLFKEESYWRKKSLLSRDELGGSSGRSIYYKDIHMPSFGRKGT